MRHYTIKRYATLIRFLENCRIFKYMYIERKKIVYDSTPVHNITRTFLVSFLLYYFARIFLPHRSIVAGTYRRTHNWGTSRTGRNSHYEDSAKPSPESIRETLLNNYKFNNHNEDYTISRTGKYNPLTPTKCA